MASKLTREGYEKLQKELVFLQTTRRREIAEALEKARAHGDLRENAEYDAAKNEQGLLEKRIAELSDTLSSATILDDADIDTSRVYLGATVTLFDLKNNRELQYLLVSKEEANLREGKISAESPIGEALIGKSIDDEVEITVPAGILHYKIVKITR